MVNYRRNRIPGGSYFFTLTLQNRKATTLVEHIDLLRNAFRHAQRQRPFTLDAIVVLPEHLHTIWTMPKEDYDFSSRWHLIKSHFTRVLRALEGQLEPDSRGEYRIWQKRFWEHTIRNGEDYIRHRDYIHFNPVKHSHVTRVRDWPWSSFHRYVRQGHYPIDWCGEGCDLEGVGRE
ncbi:MAG: transposase [Candidatus Thiodiazotropha sp.]